ncbi:MAG TPA: hypothetical protein VF179_12775 [Thermoanaerobaculia bacterium]|nr:hypothetical protein [Thermoanaerobaculia bacterium]
MLTFGLEPVYVRAAELPPQLADDPKLRIEKVDSAPPDMEVIELLKPERVQEPETAFQEPTPEAPLMLYPPGVALGAGRVFFPRRP